MPPGSASSSKGAVIVGWRRPPNEEAKHASSGSTTGGARSDWLYPFSEPPDVTGHGLRGHSFRSLCDAQQSWRLDLRNAPQGGEEISVRKALEAFDPKLAPPALALVEHAWLAPTRQAPTPSLRRTSSEYSGAGAPQNRASSYSSWQRMKGPVVEKTIAREVAITL